MAALSVIEIIPYIRIFRESLFSGRRRKTPAMRAAPAFWGAIPTHRQYFRAREKTPTY
jgi:hypothetical protein